MELLESISGVREISVMIIIAETGGDMNIFENSGKITGRAGLHPETTKAPANTGALQRPKATNICIL
jgi:hypothetical protein